MRARMTSEYEKDGKMQGEHKDQMSSMFDRKGEKSKSQRSELMQGLDSSKKRYDSQLYSDWIAKVYDKCRINCVVNPDNYKNRDAQSSQEINANMSSQLEQLDQDCGKNCLRKYDKVYKLYSHLESQIYQSFCEDQEIDTEGVFKQQIDKFETNKD